MLDTILSWIIVIAIIGLLMEGLLFAGWAVWEVGSGVVKWVVRKVRKKVRNEQLYTGTGK